MGSNPTLSLIIHTYMSSIKKTILDTETTGLDEDKDRVIEVGCVKLVNNINMRNNFHSYVNPKVNIASGAYNVHGISNLFLFNKPRFIYTANLLTQFTINSILIAHNASFDLRFLNKEFRNIGMPIIFFNNVVDTMVVAKKRFTQGLVNLDSLCRKLNIFAVRNRIKHGALIDAELLAHVYISLFYKTQKKIRLVKQKERTECFISFEKIRYNLIKNIKKREFNLYKKLLIRIPSCIWYKKFV